MPFSFFMNYSTAHLALKYSQSEKGPKIKEEKWRTPFFKGPFIGDFLATFSTAF
jgi:hypothetical protein